MEYFTNEGVHQTATTLLVGRDSATLGYRKKYQEEPTMDMMSILQGSGAVDSIARELGIDPAMAQTGAAVLLPAILGGFKKQAQTQPSGIEGLIGGLAGMGGGGLLDAVLAPTPTPVDQGNGILGQIFGSKDVSRSVASHGEAQSGISAETLKKMLPILAMVVAGYMAKQSNGAADEPAGGGGLGGMLGSVLGGGQSAGGGLGGMLGSMLGAGQAAAPAQSGSGLGGLGSLLDMDGDGNPLDDIMGMAGKMMGR